MITNPNIYGNKLTSIISTCCCATKSKGMKVARRQSELAQWASGSIQLQKV